MRMKAQEYDGVVVVDLQGDLRNDLLDILRRTTGGLLAKDKNGVIFDMSHVGFISSEGLEQLLSVRDHFYENNCWMKLACPDDNCAKILEITRLNTEFDCYESVEQAIKSYV
ncbi:MAG: STAS domain-containing protein [Planctomycetota bacterium]